MHPRVAELGVGAGMATLGGLLAAGAVSIPSEAGYGGVGPNFLPWVVALGLLVCGSLLVWQAVRGGFLDRDAPDGAAHGDWTGFAWVSAGLLANAALITRLGFLLSCALCFVLAARGFELSQGRPLPGLRGTFVSAVTGLAIAAPVYWMFTKLLAINLPGLTATGWL